MKTFSEHMKSIERIAIERAYKIYYGKELNYKAQLEEIRKERSGEYCNEPVRNAIQKFTELIEEENSKGFTYLIDSSCYDSEKNRDKKHILDQVAIHFKNIGLKAYTQIPFASSYYELVIEWK